MNDTDNPEVCRQCGHPMLDLGELDHANAGKLMCSAVVAYGIELSRRGDHRAVDHELMRADGEAFIRRAGVP